MSRSSYISMFAGLLLMVEISQAQENRISGNTVTGRVVDWVTGKGIPASTVETKDKKHATLTGQDGSYSLTNVQPSGVKALHLACHQLGYTPDPYEAEIVLTNGKGTWNVRLMMTTADNSYWQIEAKNLLAAKGAEQREEIDGVNKNVSAAGRQTILSELQIVIDELRRATNAETKIKNTERLDQTQEVAEQLKIASKPSPELAMSNEAVMKMVKAGLSDDLIIQSINQFPGTYTTTTTDLISLNQAGVSSKVVGAMLVKGNSMAVATASSAAIGPNPPVPDVDEVGVYYKDKSGQWVAMSPEIVNYKSGGALKSFASNGIVRADKNGHIAGESAALAMVKSTDFLFYVSEGTSPYEYLLLKLRPSNGKSREFRSVTGEFIHNSKGATRDSIPFTAIKVATHMYTISLPADATKGEYGILPPASVISSNASSGDKIYTFKLLE